MIDVNESFVRDILNSVSSAADETLLVADTNGQIISSQNAGWIGLSLAECGLPGAGHAIRRIRHCRIPHGGRRPDTVLFRAAVQRLARAAHPAHGRVLRLAQLHAHVASDRGHRGAGAGSSAGAVVLSPHVQARAHHHPLAEHRNALSHHRRTRERIRLHRQRHQGHEEHHFPDADDCGREPPAGKGASDRQPDRRQPAFDGHVSHAHGAAGAEERGWIVQHHPRNAFADDDERARAGAHRNDQARHHRAAGSAVRRGNADPRRLREERRNRRAGHQRRPRTARLAGGNRPDAAGTV